MKKALYYAIKLDSWLGPRIVAITLERSSHWWGRDIRDDLGTHGRKSGIEGRFDTVEAAKAVLSDVDKVVIHYSGELNKLDNAGRRLRFAKEQMLKQITRGCQQRGAEMLSVNAVISEHQVKP
jgi:hypothetical protein